MRTVATAPRSSGAKTCAKCKPLTFVHVDENDPQVEQCKSERGEGSKISRIHYVGSDRPALGSWRRKNTESSAQAWCDSTACAWKRHANTSPRLSASRLSRHQRDRGSVAPDETRDPRRAVRPVQHHVQRHQQVAEVVPAKT